ncbi:MAG TPA: iron chelate uptake ABC transporter family permease subunit [Phycisphaerae bacterium]|nr:iron chelate uptake ABC transporter family permease subunit [Phycisphaerae bacterium]
MSGWDWTSDGWVTLVAAMSAISCALPGNYLVLRKMSLMGDAISHAVLPGLAAAFLISQSRAPLPMFFGAVVVGVLTALLTQAISRFGRVEEGAAMGVIFSVLFAAGLIMIRQATDHVDLDPSCVLYGNIEHIGLEAAVGGMPPAVTNLAAVLVLNVVFIIAFYKELRICAFDPALATTVGINANLMHYALMVIVAITTVANFESVGSILVIAMLIVPAVCAHLLTDRLGLMLVISAMIAGLSAVAGRVLVVYAPGWIGVEADTNTAALMTVVAGMLLLLAVLFSPEHGLIGALLHRMSFARQVMREDILGLLYRWHEMTRGRARSMTRDEILNAVGRNFLSTRALRSLRRRGQIEIDSPVTGDALHGMRLTDTGSRRASEIVRGHRLWETYLRTHFELPLDHLHMPAERVEHFLTPELSAKLDDALTGPDVDPHGKSIPKTSG